MKYYSGKRKKHAANFIVCSVPFSETIYLLDLRRISSQIIPPASSRKVAAMTGMIHERFNCEIAFAACETGSESLYSGVASSFGPIVMSSVCVSPDAVHVEASREAFTWEEDVEAESTASFFNTCPAPTDEGERLVLAAPG